MLQHYNEPLPDLLKRSSTYSNSPVNLSTGSIVAIIIGVILLVIICSIACCCPCWEKGGARPRAMKHGLSEENVGNEMGGMNELNGNGRRVHEVLAEEIPPPKYEERSRDQVAVAIAEMPAKPEDVIVKERAMR